MSQPEQLRLAPEAIYIRPSLWPTVVLCPSAAEPPPYKVEKPDVNRSLGSAGHELYQLLPQGMEITPDDIVTTAKAWGVDPLALSELVEGAKEAWATLHPYFPSALTEHPFVDGGKADVLQLDLDDIVGAVVLDWKKREGPDHREQLLRYAYKSRAEMKERFLWTEDKIIKAVAVYCESGTYRVWEFREDDFTAMEAQEARLREDIGKIYNPGDHCSFCPRMHTCGPREESGRQALRVLRDEDTTTLSLEKASELYGKLKVVEESAGQFRRWLYATLKESGGVLQLPTGKEVYVQEYTNRDLDVVKSWGALREHGFDIHDMAKVTDISLSAAVKLVRDKADGPRGSKKKAEDALRTWMKEHDAIVETKKTRLAQRKTKEQTDE